LTDTVVSIFWYAIPIASLTFRCEVWLIRFQNASSATAGADWRVSASRSTAKRSASRSCPRPHAGSTTLSVASVASCTCWIVLASLLATVLRPLSAALAPTPISKRACPFFCMSPSTSAV
jgi:hypothetical protein